MGHLVSTAFAATLLTCGSAALSLPAAAQGHYLFAWAGDPAGKSEDFIAVIDGDPVSSNYGQLVATGASGVKTQQMHHTEYWMPESGLLFANDHAAGRTVVMDLRDPLHPQSTPALASWPGTAIRTLFFAFPTVMCWRVFRLKGTWVTRRLDFCSNQCPTLIPARRCMAASLKSMSRGR
jgi:hypothetical protein